ncbi:MAG: ABC transporter ATP-binding protein [Cyanobacteria bacterium P01_A01_bin.135]
MKNQVIELKGVSKTFGSNRVLDKVDLTLNRGEALAIIGPSGTGKSTVLRIIAGLLLPDEGEVYVDGVKRQGLVENTPDPITVGMVFQQAALFDSLTVDENVGFSLYEHSKLPRPQVRNIVRQSLKMVGLSDIGDRYPAELSGGMRKRVSFARAIISSPDQQTAAPDLLLYDEPTAGLDPIASTVIEDLIRDIQCHEQGCGTYAIVTHQDSTIRRTADRVVFLHQGSVRWQGSIGEIDSTSDPAVRQFFSGQIDGPIKVVN